MGRESPGKLGLPGCPQVVPELRPGGQASQFAEFTQIYEIESDFKAKVEATFNKMIESVTTIFV